MKRLIVLLVVAVVGCDGAHRERGDDDGMQPVTCGSVTCDQIPAASCADADTLVEYSASCVDAACSYPATQTECGAAGCCGDHCCALAVSNADATGTIRPTGLTVTPPNGQFNTDTECTASSALGACEVVARDGLPEACVCRMDELSIGELEVKGSRALVILAYETVRIQTTLDISGDLDVPGPGAMPAVYTTMSFTNGGVGASYATKGAGSSSNTTEIAATYGEATLIPLLGGTPGQKTSDNGGNGGGGGGALQITAGERIEVLGSIFAGGGGGKAGIASYSYAGGGGGGSGGAILLEAPAVVVTGKLNANGGGGGGGGGENASGWNGEDAADELASGGDGNDGGGCPLYGYVSGGTGGNGATRQTPPGVGSGSDYDSRCLGSAVFVGGGGGGGGLGRIRINTLSGCQCGGMMSPSASFGMLGVQ
ncbi:MAG TPA: hypothetical protein VIV40_39750 [Kofleriaceae bacterium]